MPSTPATAADREMPPQRALKPPLFKNSHLYIKKNGYPQRRQQTWVSSCCTNTIGRSETHLVPPAKKGQRTTSTSVITDISSFGMYITVKRLRPCCKSQLLHLIQGITSYSSSRQALDGKTQANPKILKWVWIQPPICFIIYSLS